MVHLNLSTRKASPWVSFKDTHVCGYARYKGIFLKGARLSRALHEALQEKPPKDLLEELNGFFAFIYKGENQCIAAVDRVRSIPLFYAQKNEQFFISDEAEWVRSNATISEISRSNAAEFLIAHMVTGSETLFRGLSQLQAGEYLIFDSQPNKTPWLSALRYFRYSRGALSLTSDTEQALIEELDETLLDVFERLAKSLEGRQAVIPLSGGYDSRLIAVMMQCVGYEHVKYITYGKPGNWESGISREIADFYEVPWHFIPLSQKKWYRLFNTKERINFTFSAGGFASHTIVQEYPILHDLKKQNIIDPDAIFLPGHSGGFISGYHVPAHFLEQGSVSRQQLYDYILQKNYKKWNWERSKDALKASFNDKIHSILQAPKSLSPAEACDLYEEWVWQERQAKFIIHSIRTIEHFGYEWRLPLWDNELMKFWLSVPAEVRQDRKLYKKYVEKMHRLPVSDANSPKLSKAIDRYYPTAKAWIGRYIGEKNMLQAFNIRLKDVLPVHLLPYDFIPPEKRVLFSDINAMGSMRYLTEILTRTNSKIND